MNSTDPLSSSLSTRVLTTDCPFPTIRLKAVAIRSQLWSPHVRQQSCRCTSPLTRDLTVHKVVSRARPASIPIIYHSCRPAVRNCPTSAARSSRPAPPAPCPPRPLPAPQLPALTTISASCRPVPAGIARALAATASCRLLLPCSVSSDRPIAPPITAYRHHPIERVSPTLSPPLQRAAALSFPPCTAQPTAFANKIDPRRSDDMALHVCVCEFGFGIGMQSVDSVT
jgi:hypothetical protein